MDLAFPTETPTAAPEGVTTMRAAVLHAPGKLRAQGVPRPTLADDQVLIRIQNCGVCPSDVRWYTGEREGGTYPRMLGHEWCGVIEKVGKHVQGFAEGDRVVPDWRVVCGECYHCRRGVANYCENLKPNKVRGGYAEYGVAPPTNLRKLPAPVTFAEACFTEPLACVINGNRMCRLKPGDDVVVLGCGQIGLMHIQLAKHQGARVIAGDPIRKRLPDARNFGADDLIMPDDDPVEKVMTLTDGRGANCVIVAVGNAKAMESALQMAGVLATVNFFAGTYPPTTLTLDPNDIHYKQLFVTGSHDYTPHDFTTALKLIALRTVKVNELISTVLPLDRIEEAFNMVAQRQGLKLMIEL